MGEGGMGWWADARWWDGMKWAGIKKLRVFLILFFLLPIQPITTMQPVLVDVLHL